LSELETRTERADGRTSNSLTWMRNNKIIRYCWCRVKNVKLSLWLPFKKLTNSAVIMVSDVTGTDCHVTSGRSTSVVRWRQLPFAAEALNYSQIIMTVAFGHKRSSIKSSLQRILYLLVVYIYLLFYCRGNRTHWGGLLGLISNYWESNMTTYIKW